MPFEVAWSLMFRVNDAAAANRCITRVLAILAANVNDAPKQYWKMPELWEVSLRSPFGATTAEAVLNLMVVADRIASGWLITGPLIVDDAVTSLEGVFNAGAASRPHVAGLEWASFSVGHF